MTVKCSVGANSPNLCPTISRHRHRYEFPTVRHPKSQSDNCGMIVERRDHVLITSLRPDSRTTSAFFKRLTVNKRTFPNKRAISVSRYFFRRRRISLSVDLLDLVRLPLVGLPQGVTGWRPPELLPSPTTMGGDQPGSSQPLSHADGDQASGYVLPCRW